MFVAYLRGIKPGWQPIAGQACEDFGGFFFRGPIIRSTKVWSIAQSEGWTVEILDFFSNGQVKRQVALLFGNDKEVLSPSQVDKRIGAAIGATGKFDSVSSKLMWQSGKIEPLRETVSMFLRESKSLTPDEFQSLNKMSVVADAKGVAVVDASPLEPGQRAHRLSYVLALSCAYLASLNDAIDKLALAAQQGDDSANKQIEVWSAYLAEYYFVEPVSANTVELMFFYGIVRERQRINICYQEVTQQLSTLAQLAQVKRGEAQRRQSEALTSKASRIQIWIAFLSCVVALVAATQIAQVTPKNFLEFSKSWRVSMTCIFEATTASCLEKGAASIKEADPAESKSSIQKSQAKSINAKSKR